MIVGDGDDGVFVEKYIKPSSSKDIQKPLLKKRNLLDFVPYKHIKTMSGKRSSETEGDIEENSSVQKKKRSSTEGSGMSKRSVEDGSGARKKRSAHTSKIIKGNAFTEGSAASEKQRKRRSIEGSGMVKRSTEGSGMNLRKRRSIEGSGANLRKQRSVEGSGMVKRSTEGSGMVKRSTEGSGMNLRKRRAIEGSGANLRKQRSVEAGSGAALKKREVSMADLPDGAVKMAARSGDVNDIEASLKALEYLAKRDEVPKGN